MDEKSTVPTPAPNAPVGKVIPKAVGKTKLKKGELPLGAERRAKTQSLTGDGKTIKGTPPKKLVNAARTFLMDLDTFNNVKGRLDKRREDLIHAFLDTKTTQITIKDGNGRSKRLLFLDVQKVKVTNGEDPAAKNN